MFEIPQQILTELAKSSPFAVVCIIFVIILNSTYNKNVKELNTIHQKTIDDIKQVYKEVYEIFDKRVKAKV